MTQTGNAKNWCFTVNNPTPETTPSFDSTKMKYLVYGRETGENGTPHLQGYVSFIRRRKFNSLKKDMPTAHLEVAKGSPEVNFQYCSKDGDFEQFGELPVTTQGRRTDLERLHDTIKSGSSITDIVEQHFGAFCRYPKAIDRARELYRTARNWPMDVHVYWGSTGTGKTRSAFDQYPDAYFKDHSAWWDGYEDHETVIWDEFYGGTIKVAEFLRLTDRYPHRVPVKGGYRQFVAKRIIFTSNDPPTEWYSHLAQQKPEVYAAFERRLTEIKRFD